MPINSTHPEYRAYQSQWQKCRVAVEGEDAIKMAGDAYLPKLGGADESEYRSYKARASFFGASNRTVMGLTGSVTRKPPQIEWPEGKKDLLDRIGIEGESIDALANYALEEVITSGRCGLMVDAPPEEGDPYITFYYPENIINWDREMGPDETGKVREKLTMVIVSEEVLVPDKGDDPYQKSYETRYRELRLDEEGLLVVSIWKKRPEDRMVITNDTSWKKDWVKVGEDVLPTFRGGKRLNFIPFKFITPSGTTCELEKSPILDLVNVNIAHYRNSADLEHGLHFTALPTAWVSGFETGSDALFLGSTKAWSTENEHAKAGFLEFSGAGLGSIVSEMTKKEAQMAVLGARLLEETKAAAEAAETVALRQSGESSVLAKVAGAVSEGLTWALKVVAQWMKVGDEKKVKYELNKRFNTKSLTSADLQSLMGMLQGGAMSFEVFYYNMERGEMYPDGHTQEQEEELIEKGPPKATPVGGPISLEGPGATNQPGGGPPNPNAPPNPNNVPGAAGAAGGGGPAPAVVL
jgi:hypothetical protein